VLREKENIPEKRERGRTDRFISPKNKSNKKSKSRKNS